MMKKAIDVSKNIAKLCEKYPETPDGFDDWKENISLFYSKVS